MSDKRDYHVIPSPGGGWSVRRQGAGRSSGVFDRQSEAVDYARQLARSSKSEIIKHGRDGRIRGTVSYGQDSSPPKSDNSKTPMSYPKGYGSMSGRFTVKPGIDVTKPIYEQVEREKKQGSRDRKR